jgi:hypothetical protein
VTVGLARGSGVGSPAEPLPAPRLIRLSRVSLFAGLPPERVAWLERRLPVVRWLYGTPRPHGLTAPDHLFVVREGVWRCSSRPPPVTR